MPNNSFHRNKSGKFFLIVFFSQVWVQNWDECGYVVERTVPPTKYKESNKYNFYVLLELSAMKIVILPLFCIFHIIESLLKVLCHFSFCLDIFFSSEQFLLSISLKLVLYFEHPICRSVHLVSLSWESSLLRNCWSELQILWD